MDEDKNYIVNGFYFQDDKAAKKATNEYLKIKKIESKLNTQNVKGIYLLYQKAIDNKSFKTIIGYSFLKKIQNFLIQNGYTDLRPIIVEEDAEETNSEVIFAKTEKKIIRELENKVKRYKYIIAVLIFLVITIFIISTTGSRPTVLNYERALQNKYAEWEEELKERENVVRQKERELKISIQ